MYVVFKGSARMCVPMPGAPSGSDLICLLPGLNVMDDKAWTYCKDRLSALHKDGVLAEVTEKKVKGLPVNVARRLSKSK